MAEGAIVDLLAAKSADEAASFVALIRPELPQSYRFAGYLLGDEAEADAATCEAVARAWRARASIRAADKFPAWFGRIVANVCRDRIRRRAGIRLVDLEQGTEAHERDQFRDALARDEVGRLVRKLPPDQQIVVALRFWRDLTLEEIAERLDMPLGTVKSRLHYAMRTLRKELDRQEKVSR